MERTRYFNVILTVIAVLLAGLLWTSVAGKPLVASQAWAQTGAKKAPFSANSTSQRQDMIRALRDMQSSVDTMNQMLKSGRVKVYVTNLSDVRVDK